MGFSTASKLLPKHPIRNRLTANQICFSHILSGLGLPEGGHMSLALQKAKAVKAKAPRSYRSDIPLDLLRNTSEEREVVLVCQKQPLTSGKRPYREEHNG